MRVEPARAGLSRTAVDLVVLSDYLVADPRFKDALIIKTPFGHNPFPLTDPEWDAIRSRSRGMAGP